MDGLATCTEVNPTKDCMYVGKDAKRFVKCYGCVRYSPFMFYIVGNDPRVHTSIIPTNHKVLCVHCLPKPSDYKDLHPDLQLYSTDSILNNESLLNLFTDFECYNPFYAPYSSIDRIIITENTRLTKNYKAIMRQKMPATVKLQKLMALFPAVHRYPMKKFLDVRTMQLSLQQKYKEITEAYGNMTADVSNQLRDNLDMLVDQTPMHQRRRRDSATPLLLESSLDMMRCTNSSIDISSQSVAASRNSSTDLCISSQEQPSQPTNTDDESIDISNESRQASVLVSDSFDSSVDTVAAVPVVSSHLSSDVSSDIEIESVPALPTLPSPEPGRDGRIIDTTDDGQQPGVSGLQQQQQHRHDDHQSHELRPSKRRRISQKTPINPPAEWFRDIGSVRMPRLGGG